MGSVGLSKEPEAGMTELKHHLLKVHDLVVKEGGDYSFEGCVVGVITKRSGAVRYVVEDDRGLLFIFNRKQLVFMGRPRKEKGK